MPGAGDQAHGFTSLWVNLIPSTGEAVEDVGLSGPALFQSPSRGLRTGVRSMEDRRTGRASSQGLRDQGWGWEMMENLIL